MQSLVAAGKSNQQPAAAPRVADVHVGAIVELRGVLIGMSQLEPTADALAPRLQRLEDLMAIQQLFIDYGRYLDAGDIDAYASLFAEDGEVLLGPLGRAKGRAAIKELMGKALDGKQGSSYH